MLLPTEPSHQPQVELFLIPVVNVEFYPSCFLPVLPYLYSFVLCKNPVTSLYLAGVSPNFPIFFCIKSLMLDLTNYIQIHTPSCRICLSIPANSLPTCDQRPVQHRQGTRGSVANMLYLPLYPMISTFICILTNDLSGNFWFP